MRTPYSVHTQYFVRKNALCVAVPTNALQFYISQFCTGRQWNIVSKESTKNEKRLQELKKKNSLQDNTYYNSIYETYIFCAFNKYVFIFIYVPRRHLTPLFVADWHIWSTQSNAYVLYFINILIL